MEKGVKTYLNIPCDLDSDKDGGCGYKYISVLGCGRNPGVTEPGKCHHYRCMVAIGLHKPEKEVI